jgi:hypothetical protein
LLIARTAGAGVWADSLPGKGERPREPKYLRDAEEIKARGDNRPPGKSASGVDDTDLVQRRCHGFLPVLNSVREETPVAGVLSIAAVPPMFPPNPARGGL